MADLIFPASKPHRTSKVALGVTREDGGVYLDKCGPTGDFKLITRLTDDEAREYANLILSTIGAR
jgi:hypothetical protein